MTEYVKKCKMCDKEFVTTVTNKTFCTPECKRLHNHNLYESRKKYITTTCLHCGAQFTTTNKRKKFCKTACARRYEKNLLKEQRKEARESTVKKCPICSESFNPSNPKRIYCSNECKEKAESIRGIEKRAKEAKSYTKTCIECGKEFVTKVERQKYCCKSCERKFNHRKEREPKQVLEKVCPNCGRKYAAKACTQVFCSPECSKEYSLAPEKVEITKICEYCGKEFVTTNPFKRYCHGNCSAAAYRDRNRVIYNKICPTCGKKFETLRSLDVYCSKECYKAFRPLYNDSHRVERPTFKKVCPECGIEFETKEKNKTFCSRSCGYKTYARLHEDRIKARRKKYYIENIDKIRKAEENRREIRKAEENRREIRKAQKREYYFSHIEEKRAYAELHKDRIRENSRLLHLKKMKEDPNYRASRTCRHLVHRCLKAKKSLKTLEILGYTPEELRAHIESQFYDGMSWGNVDSWEVHHIQPVSTFNFINEDGTNNYDKIREANALSNLVPLFKEDHLKVTDRYMHNGEVVPKEEIIEKIINERLKNGRQN